MIRLVAPSGALFDLPVQTDELQAQLDELYDAGRLSELYDPHTFLEAISSDFPHPPVTEWPRPRLGSLYWPIVGAARYAFACLLVDEYTLGQIRADMVANSSGYLVVRYYDDPDDALESPRGAIMHFLMSRPLVRTTSGALTTDDDGVTPVDAWVMILVDDRYQWLQNSRVGDVGGLTPTAWDASSFFSPLYPGGITITDAADADYLVPSTRWTTDRASGRSGAWLADVGALSIGSRFVSIPSPGSSLSTQYPALQRPTGTNKTALSSAHTAAGTRHVGGGPIEDADVDAGLPPKVQVWFGGFDEATPVVNNTNTGVTGGWALTLGPSHWADALAATAGADRTALAAQFTADWLAWQYGLYDTTYSGFVQPPASGFLWACEWFHSAGQGYTKFIRPPAWYGCLNAPQVGGDAPAPTAGPTADTPSPTMAADPSTSAETVIPQYTVESTVNGDPQIKQYTVANLGADPTSAPVYQFVVTNDSDGSGTPRIQQYQLTDGTSGGTGVTSTLIPTQYTVDYTLDSVTPLQYTVADYGSGVPVFQYTVDNAPTTAPILQYVLDNTGNTITQNAFVDGTSGGTGVTTALTSTTYTLAEGGSSMTYALAFNAVDMTGVGSLDLTGVTVTGLSTGARTEGTLAAAGSTQGTAAAIVTDAVAVSGADGTKGVILPNTAAAMILIDNTGASTLKVYPNSGAQIGSGGANNAESLFATAKKLYTRVSSTQWYGVNVL